jgi:hypothetical protein
VNSLAITDHARQRMAQRGIADSDLDLILLIGTEVDDGIVVRSRDCTEAIRALKQLTTRIERLAGKRIVYANGSIVTAYRTAGSKMKRLLKRD